MNKLQSKIVEMLLNSLPGVLAVYRFGSWGAQQERRESDIGLAVLPLQPLSPPARWETAQKLAQMLSRDVDWWICAPPQQ
ncbi:MAG TPA: nucleotidyltransferase domain-containing protein [Sulfuricella sp.]|nr:nucleotidyltransferase domain-containing protein [Sulfuricella sp.]